MIARNKTARILSYLSGAIIVAIMVLFPSGYFGLSKRTIVGELKGETEVNARILTQIISLNPEYWEFEQTRISEYLDHRPEGNIAEMRRIINRKNEVVAISTDELPPPLIMSAIDIMDAGVVAGKLEIYRSLQPLLKETIFVFLAVLPLGVGAFIILYILPIRAVERAETALWETNEQLHRENIRCRQAEEEILKLNMTLEARVVTRTVQLDSAYQQLKTQMAELRQAEEALRESERRYRELVYLLPIALFEIDELGNVVSGNPLLYKTFGYDRDDLDKAMNVFEMIVPNDVKDLSVIQKRIFSEEITQGTEFAAIRKDGSAFPILVFSSPIDRDDKIVGLRGAIVDLTEKKAAEEKIQRINASLAEAQRIANIGNWEWNVKNDEMYWSDEIYRIYDMPCQVCKGSYKVFMDIVYHEDRAIVDAAIEKVINGGGRGDFEHRIIRYDGAIREVRQKMEIMDNNSCNDLKLLGIVQDITVKNQTARELQKTRDLLIQSEKLASIGRLSAGVAHEILNPMNIISMELQLLQMTEALSADVRKELDICMSQVKRVVNFTENLKQHSVIPQNRLAINDINEIVNNLFMLFSNQLRIDGVDTEIVLQPDLPVILVDREKIEQVIMNLMTNAVKAMEKSDKKQLFVTTALEVKPEGDEFLQIVIADTGIGIKKEEMAKIFDPFFTTRSQEKGTGLGLFISYNIVTEYQGRIWAENNSWGGASFHVELPVQRNANG